MSYNYPSAPTPRAAQNGFGTTALVLGIIGLLFSFIPLIGVIAWPLVILGLVFALLGFVRVNAGQADNKGTVIAGAVTSGLGLIVCIVWVVGAAAVIPTGVAAGTVAAAPQVPALPASSPESQSTVAQLGQTFTYPDGLAVSIAAPQTRTASQYAAPEQYRNKQVTLLTVTVTNNSNKPYQLNDMVAGPNVAQGGQAAVQVFDNSLPTIPPTTVLPGKSFSYQQMFAMTSGDIQAEWKRDMFGSPAVFTG